MQPLDFISVYLNMKKHLKSTLSILILLLSSNLLHAQNDNTPSNDEYESFFNPISIRGNIGLHSGTLATKNNNLVLKTGGSVAVILNHKLALGFTGTGFVGSQNVTLNNTTYSMAGGYGGLLIEPILMPKKSIHVSFPVTIGAGEVQYFEDDGNYRDWHYHYSYTDYNDFILIEPGINVEANLTNFMRFGVSGSYVFTNSVSNTVFKNSEIDGLSLTATLKFGWFK